MLLACYGSLKKGAYNHKILGDAELLGNTKALGVMYFNGSYPKLYKVENDDYDSPFRLPFEKEHDVEVYRVEPQAFHRIHQMELGAGYVEEKLDTEWGEASIYYMPHENFDEEDKLIDAYIVDVD